jgi:magnesium-transporting ATPase (P-type)
MANAHKEEAPASSNITLIFGLLIMMSGISMFIMFTIEGMMGHPRGELNTYFSISLIFVGLGGILISEKLPSRFLIGSIMCFISAGTFLVIWRTFLPRMEEMSNEFREAEETGVASSNGGGVSVFNPQDVSFDFYNNMFIFMIVAFIIIGIILIIIYKKQNKIFKTEETIS